MSLQTYEFQFLRGLVEVPGERQLFLVLVPGRLFQAHGQPLQTHVDGVQYVRELQFFQVGLVQRLVQRLGHVRGQLEPRDRDVFPPVVELFDLRVKRFHHLRGQGERGEKKKQNKQN